MKSGYKEIGFGKQTIAKGTPPMICLQYYDAPCGELILASMGEALCLCDWNGKPCAERSKRRIARYVDAEFCTASSPVLEQAKLQLDDYFAGHRPSLHVPLHPFGTDFQLRVWQALLQIPYGETRSYLEVAQRVGNPRGVRAVAQAIGANGISILIPCHRVIGSNRSLTGFTGGLNKKSYLLELERVNSL